MNDIARALGRALVSQFHPRMLWLAVWPFLAALVGWGVIALFVHGIAVDWLASALAGSWVGAWIDTGFSWFGLGRGIEFVAGAIFLVSIFALMVLTALLIIATVAMPAVVTHVGGRDYPTLVRKNGGSYAASFANAIWVGVVFIVGFVCTIPLWVVAPLALLLPLLWWGWATARMFRYDALVAHASAEERSTLFARHGRAFFAIGTIVSLLNFVPPLFFLVPILGGLAFTHYALHALARLRTERGEPTIVDRPIDPTIRRAVDSVSTPFTAGGVS